LACFLATVLGSIAASSWASSPELGSAKEFDKSHRWHLFYSGDRVHGWDFTDVLRSRSEGHPNWTFFYGDCADSTTDSCSPRLQVQAWNVCVRYFARYPGKPKLIDFHGAKAARIPTADDFEVYTGRSTIAIFGPYHAARRAAAKLRRVVRRHSPESLSPPAKGSLQGKLHCQR
jgi:hypothetical protein